MYVIHALILTFINLFLDLTSVYRITDSETVQETIRLRLEFVQDLVINTTQSVEALGMQLNEELMTIPMLVNVSHDITYLLRA